MDNLEKDVAAALRLGYGCQYGRYKVDHPHTADHTVDLIPEEEEVDPPKQCRHCGKEFRPDNGNQVFCSEECRVDRRRLLDRINKSNAEKRPIGQAVCPVCDKTFAKLTRNHTYCSRSCAAVVRNKTRRKR